MVGLIGFIAIAAVIYGLFHHYRGDVDYEYPGGEEYDEVDVYEEWEEVKEWEET